MSDFYKRLAKVQNDIGVLEKSADNPFFKSKYADITSMLKQIQPILNNHNFVMMQPSKIIEGKTCQGTVIACMETGDIIESWCIMPEIDDPQKKFAASTYFRRLTLQNLLATMAEDDDGNEASGRSSGSKRSSSARSSKRSSRNSRDDF